MKKKIILFVFVTMVAIIFSGCQTVSDPRVVFINNTNEPIWFVPVIQYPQDIKADPLIQQLDLLVRTGQMSQASAEEALEKRSLQRLIQPGQSVFVDFDKGKKETKRFLFLDDIEKPTEHAAFVFNYNPRRGLRNTMSTTGLSGGQYGLRGPFKGQQAVGVTQLHYLTAPPPFLAYLGKWPPPRY